MPTSERPSEGARGALRWLLELLVVGAAFVAINAWQARDLPHGDLPAFKLRTIDGGTFSSAALTERPTLLLFWAPWCGVCGAESQNVSWAQSLAGSRARVVSVATSYRTADAVRAYMADHEVDYPVLLDDTGLARRLGVRSFPTAFVVDARGKIVRAVTGYTTTLGLLWRVLLG